MPSGNKVIRSQGTQMKHTQFIIQGSCKSVRLTRNTAEGLRPSSSTSESILERFYSGIVEKSGLKVTYFNRGTLTVNQSNSISIKFYINQIL